MTIIKPTVQDVGAYIHMRVIRMAYSAFLDGPGLVNATDLAATGDPSLLRFGFAPGTAFVEMPGEQNGYVPFISDGIEYRSLATAPGSGNRTDVVYLGVKDIESGSNVNDLDLYIDTNPTVGTGTAPAYPTNPDIIATYELGTITVPAKVTKGSQCVFKKTAQTTAPVRDGGFTSGDVNLTAPFFYEHVKVTVGGGGNFDAKTAAPFVPRAVIVTPTSPIGFNPNIVGSIIINRATFKSGTYGGQMFTVLAAPVAAGTVVEYDAIIVR